MNKKLMVMLVMFLLVFSSAYRTVDLSYYMVDDDPPADDSDEEVGDQEEDQEKPYEIVYEEQFEIWDPYTEVLEEELLEKIGASGFTGTDEEIAQQIYDWQTQYMVYAAGPDAPQEASYQGRWNLFLPGIYPASELLVEHVKEDGKIFGICSDYSLVFCAIANTYGLECRNSVFTKYTFSQVNAWVDPETTRGLSVEEYEALNEKLEKQSVELTYDQIDRVAREGYAHMRPEVKIGDEWVSYDGASIAPTGDFLVEENFEILPFDADYNNVLLYAPVAMESNILNIENLAELLTHWPQLPYEGMTDDAGDENRAASFIDLCRGLGLVPYYEDPYQLIEFLKMDPANADVILEDIPEIMEEFERETGKPFYAIADFLVYGDDEMAAEDYVYLYNAITGSDLTEEEFTEFLE